MALVKTLEIKVEGRQYQVVGDAFSVMLQCVKAIPDRKWGEFVGEGKVWLVPGTLAEVREQLSPLKVIDNEEDLIELEIQVIRDLQAKLQWFQEVARYVAEHKWRHATTYSFKSKSSRKASEMADSGCLNHAIDYAQKPINQITEPEISTLKRAVQILDAESSIPVECWIECFRVNPHSSMPTEAFRPRIVPIEFVGLNAVPTRELPIIGQQFLFGVYLLEIADKLNTPVGLLPQIEVTERPDPTGALRKVVVFQVEAPGDDS